MKIDRRCPHLHTTLAQLIRQALLPTLAAILPMSALAAIDEPVEQDLTLIPFEQLMKTEVVSASKLARQVSDAPSAVSIVTAEDIRAHGYQTLADVIHSFPGLYTTYDRNYEYMGGRGFGKSSSDFSGRIMLMIDGYATQDNVFSQVFLGHDGFLDLDLVERIEYVPGTGAVSYGNNAMLGIINIVTKHGSDFNGTQVSTTLSSYGGQKQRVTYGKQFENGADLLLSYSGMTIDGKKLSTAHEFDALGQALGQNLSTPFRRDSDTNSRFFAKLTLNNDMIEVGHVDRQKYVPTGYYSFNAPGLRMQSIDRNTFINARHEEDLTTNLKSSTRLYAGSTENRDNIDFIRSSALTLSGDMPQDQWTNRINQHTGDWFGIDQKFAYDAFANHTIIFGVEARLDSKQDYIRSYYYPDGTRVDASGKKYIHHNDRVTTSLYLEDQVHISPNTQLVLGLRDDQTSDGFHASSPRASLIQNIASNTLVKLSRSHGFKFPNGYDLYQSTRYGYQASPEYVQADELVLQHQPSATQQVNATIFDYHISNQTYDDPVTGDRRTDGKSRASGFELAYQSKNIVTGSRLSTSFSTQYARDWDGSRLANSPENLAKLRYSLPVARKTLRLGAEAEYFGKRYDYANKPMSGFAIANATISSERKFEGISFAFTVKNIFDKRYEVPTYLPGSSISIDSGPSAGTTYDISRPDRLRMDGRTFWLQASYDF